MSDRNRDQGSSTFRLHGIQLFDLGTLLCLAMPAMMYFTPHFAFENVAMDKTFSVIMCAIISGFVAACLSAFPREITIVDGREVACRGRMTSMTIPLSELIALDRVEGQKPFGWNSGWWLRFRGGLLWVTDSPEFAACVESLYRYRPELREPGTQTSGRLGTGALWPILALLLGSSALGWAVHAYPRADWYNPHAPVMVILIGAGSILWMLGASSAASKKPWKLTPVLALRAGLAAGTSCGLLGILLLANGMLDGGQVDRRAMTVVRVERTAWRGGLHAVVARDALDPHRTVRCLVNSDVAMNYPVGGVFHLMLHAGALGISWMERPDGMGINDLTTKTLPRWVKLDP